MREILLVGEDSVLVATRAAVLSRTGAKVICFPSAASPDQVVDHDIAVVILCHTLQQEAARKFIAATARHWPQARLIRLLPGIGHYPALACESNVVNLEGPSQLLDRVREILKPPSD